MATTTMTPRPLTRPSARDGALWGLPDPAAQPEFYADVAPKRLIAWVFDTALTLLLCLVILPFTAFTALFFWPVFYLVVGFIYRWVTIAGGSATLGMRLMSIELRRGDGQRLGGGMALMHTLGYSISMAFTILQVVSVIMMGTTPRNQGLTDTVLGTAMINRPRR